MNMMATKTDRQNHTEYMIDPQMSHKHIGIGAALP